MNSYLAMEACFQELDQLDKMSRHPNWRVRYAAAVSMGETRSTDWLPSLKAMLRHEATRDLYTQPPAVFTNASDDTRMAEIVGPIDVHFDSAPTEKMLEDWRCRGRVKQAILFAIHEIGVADKELLELINHCITRESEDYPVKAAAARALGAVGNEDSLPILKIAEAVDEWCTQTEARKAITRITHDETA